jgi:hypothetical protein
MRVELQLLIWTVAFVALIGVGIYVATLARRWWQDPAAPETDDLLERYRTMRDAGELDPQEFERIRARLEGEDPTPPAAGPPPSSPTP